MSIQALPPSTVNIIGSSQVLTDPASVVKELVDNALDARATSIFVEIAVNTLDVIQVRDNGHGIAPDDRALVCRRYCTSKIREYSDLKGLGGKWLGFRGEALASAAELSSSLVITTKVDGEEVAVALKVNTNGAVEGQDRASHPVGTTVRINDIFKYLPVRRQTALKASAKTLTKTKRMLQAYALARPSTRFSLRVLKAKSDKSNWMYAPSGTGGIEDAAFRVVGKECAGQCDWMVVEHDGFQLQAFLPRSNSEASKISNIGCFISVDSRPVSTTRGTLKQVNSLYREKLRNSSANLENAKDPFIWLNITCPPHSYDPNVEPAKDDLMFEDSSKVLEAVGEMLNKAYPRAEPVQSESTASGAIEIFEDTPTLESDVPTETRHPVQTNMYSRNDEGTKSNPYEVQSPNTSDEDDIESGSGLRDVSISNPWVMAKMNTSSRPRRINSLRNGQLLSPLQERNDSGANSMSTTEAAIFPPHPPWTLPTPEASSSTLREDRRIVRSISGSPGQQFHSPNDRIPPTLEIDDSEDEDASLLRTHPNQRRGWTAINDFVPAARLPLDLYPTEPSIPRHRQQRSRSHFENPSNINKPFVSPVKDDSRVWFDGHGRSSSIAKRSPGVKRKRPYPDLDMQQQVLTAAEGAGERALRRRQPRRSPADSALDDDMLEESTESVTGAVQLTLEDYFARHRTLINDDNGSASTRIRISDHTPSVSIGRQSVLRDVLHSTSTQLRPTPLSLDLPPPDSNYQHPPNIRDLQHQPNASPPPHRTTRAPSRALSRTARLPLERVPAGAELHNLLANVSLSVDMLATSLRQFLRSEECRSAREGHGYSGVGAPAWGCAAGAGQAVGLSEGDEDEGGEGPGAENSGAELCGTAFDDPPVEDSDVDVWAARLDTLLRSLRPGQDGASAASASMLAQHSPSMVSEIAPALHAALRGRESHGAVA